jgi:hypothetical protein
MGQNKNIDNDSGQSKRKQGYDSHKMQKFRLRLPAGIFWVNNSLRFLKVNCERLMNKN